MLVEDEQSGLTHRLLCTLRTASCILFFQSLPCGLSVSEPPPGSGRLNIGGIVYSSMRPVILDLPFDHVWNFASADPAGLGPLFSSLRLLSHSQPFGLKRKPWKQPTATCRDEGSKEPQSAHQRSDFVSSDHPFFSSPGRKGNQNKRWTA